MSKKITGNREPVEYQLSMNCTVLKKTVTLHVQQKIDGYPPIVEWKKILSCSGNCQCNPDDPTTFPKDCPALKVQINKRL
jgi:hypothetical protein